MPYLERTGFVGIGMADGLPNPFGIARLQACQYRPRVSRLVRPRWKAAGGCLNTLTPPYRLHGLVPAHSARRAAVIARPEPGEGARRTP